MGKGELIRQVAAANPRTIVVITAAGAVQTSDWDRTVPAVLHAWYGGQEQGIAIARILFGDVNPSAKLPITIQVDDTRTPIMSLSTFPVVRGTPSAAAARAQCYSSALQCKTKAYECLPCESMPGAMVEDGATS